eukprot:SAG31_NODE_797_length_12029_cov_13.875692_7_plen_121_part_00
MVSLVGLCSLQDAVLQQNPDWQAAHAASPPVVFAVKIRKLTPEVNSETKGNIGEPHRTAFPVQLFFELARSEVLFLVFLPHLLLRSPLLYLLSLFLPFLSCPKFVSISFIADRGSSSASS